jgi:hypothetical protein
VCTVTVPMSHGLGMCTVTVPPNQVSISGHKVLNKIVYIKLQTSCHAF